MRSSQATGVKSFLNPRHKDKVQAIIERHAKLTGTRVYEYANAGNHLHMIVRVHNAKLFKAFLCAITGLIARLILKAEKGRRVLTSKKFWDARPFTRIATWGRAYEDLKSYLMLNKLEAIGFFAHLPRNHKRRKIIRVGIDPITFTV